MKTLITIIAYFFVFIVVAIIGFLGFMVIDYGVKAMCNIFGLTNTSFYTIGTLLTIIALGKVDNG